MRAGSGRDCARGWKVDVIDEGYTG
jgi:hypothetical protein